MQLWATLFRYFIMGNCRNRIAFFIAASMALSFFSDAEASSPKYEALADSADNYIRREKWEEAERVIISALKLEPGNFANSLLFSNLGVVRTNQGRYDEALEAFDLGVSVAPRASVIRTNRARTYLLMSRYDEALEDLNVSLGIDSVQEWPLSMRGLLLMNKNDFEGARKDFMLLAKKFPQNESSMAGLAYIAEREGKFEDALRYFDESLSIRDLPETHYSSILLKIRLDRYSEASEELRGCISKYPEDAMFYLFRGYLHKLNYRNEEAAADKKIALDKGLDPQIVEQYLPR